MTLSKNQKLVLLILGLLVIAGTMVLSYVADSDKNSQEKRDKTNPIMIEDPVTFKPEGSKLKAYQRTSDYFDSLEDDEITDELYTKEEDTQTLSATPSDKGSSSRGTTPGVMSQDDMFNFLNEENTKKGSSSSSRGSSSRSRDTRTPQQKADDFRQDSYERYSKSVEKSVNSTVATPAAPEIATPTPAETPAPTPKRSIGDSVDIRKTSTMSSLDGFENNGFSTLGEQEHIPLDAEYPFECMFVRAEKLRNGSRVSVRLLEDMVVGGKLIPKNTHLMAMVQIGERLFLNVTSIEMGSRIYRLDYEAYDSDGGLGIYCPDLSAATRSTTQSKGSSVVRRILGSRLGGLASDALDVGIQVAQNKAGEVTVSVPSGYKFFIVQKKQN